jgi:hypothetical protein
MSRMQLGTEAEKGSGKLSGLQTLRRANVLHMCTAVLWRLRESSVQEVHSRGWRRGRPLVLGLLRARYQLMSDFWTLFGVSGVCL